MLLLQSAAMVLYIHTFHAVQAHLMQLALDLTERSSNLSRDIFSLHRQNKIITHQNIIHTSHDLTGVPHHTNTTSHSKDFSKQYCCDDKISANNRLLLHNAVSCHQLLPVRGLIAVVVDKIYRLGASQNICDRHNGKQQTARHEDNLQGQVKVTAGLHCWHARLLLVNKTHHVELQMCL